MYIYIYIYIYIYLYKRIIPPSDIDGFQTASGQRGSLSKLSIIIIIINTTTTTTTTNNNNNSNNNNNDNNDTNNNNNSRGRFPIFDNIYIYIYIYIHIMCIYIEREMYPWQHVWHLRQHMWYGRCGKPCVLTTCCNAYGICGTFVKQKHNHVCPDPVWKPASLEHRKKLAVMLRGFRARW